MVLQRAGKTGLCNGGKCAQRLLAIDDFVQFPEDVLALHQCRLLNAFWRSKISRFCSLPHRYRTPSEVLNTFWRSKVLRSRNRANSLACSVCSTPFGDRRSCTWEKLNRETHSAIGAQRHLAIEGFAPESQISGQAIPANYVLNAFGRSMVLHNRIALPTIAN